MINGTPIEQVRRIILSGTVREDTAAVFLEQMTALEYADLKKPIVVYIDTFGGCLDAAITIYDTMQACVCPVHTVGIGKVMSAGVLLLAAGDPGYRYISKNTRVMVHEISGGVFGSVADMNTSVKEMNRMQDTYVRILAEHTRQPKDRILADMRKTVYLSADEAIGYGIADCLLPTKIREEAEQIIPQPKKKKSNKK